VQVGYFEDVGLGEDITIAVRRYHEGGYNAYDANSIC
jgi:hypothetical protein